MEGQVKWFSAEKGYGFITGADSTDRYFAVRDVVGPDLPGNGDSVNFEHRQGNKGPRASSVTITKRAEQSRADDRVACPHCHKKMVPRIITKHGSLSKSVCPFCGGTYKDFGWCFIASAVYGSADAPEVVALRHFRDNSLRRLWLGRVFIKAYYNLSPPAARFIARHPRVSSQVRKLLDAWVRRCG